MQAQIQTQHVWVQNDVFPQSGWCMSGLFVGITRFNMLVKYSEIVSVKWFQLYF